MNRIAVSLHRGLLVAMILIFVVFLFPPELCSAFQFSIRSRRNLALPQPYNQLQLPLKSPASSHWSYRQRPPQKSYRNFGSTKFNGNNKGLYAAGYYALPHYWGNAYTARSRAIISSGGYPSNITAYDTEFRRSLTTPVQTNVHRAPDTAPTPATITNQHFQESPQQVINSNFDLQQRLLESRATPLIKSAPAASNLQGHAEKAFREGRYNDATYYCDRAVKADPYNGLTHLFCSQCNFAIGKYSASILMLEKATGLLPEARWGYISKNYDTFYGQDDYVAHTRSLANYLKRRPDDNRARTLLGYHYGCLGYKTTASKLFHQSLQTYRNDELAQRLLPIFGEAGYTSPVEKQIQAPTPDLLDEPTITQVGVEQGYGNRLIYLTPEQTVTESSIEELPTPEEIFFDGESDQDAAAESVLLPSLDGSGGR